jgi:hypothetical protein
VCSSDLSVPASTQITILGIRGGVYQNTNITSQCTFVKSGSAGAAITCGSATGIVTAGSAATQGQTALITATYASGSLTDSVVVTVGA